MTSERERLLPCPFCGNDKNISVANERLDLSGGYFIACPECDASTGLRYACGEDPRPLLIEQWNRRAALPAPADQPPSQEAREYPPLPEADAWPLGPAVPFFGPEKMRSYVDADRKARQQEARAWVDVPAPQEPAAWRYRIGPQQEWIVSYLPLPRESFAFEWEPLYAAPAPDSASPLSSSTPPGKISP